jgi:hypothetical protein
MRTTRVQERERERVREREEEAQRNSVDREP